MLRPVFLASTRNDPFLIIVNTVTLDGVLPSNSKSMSVKRKIVKSWWIVNLGILT